MLTKIEETSEIKIGFSEIEVFYGMTVSYPEELNLFKNDIMQDAMNQYTVSTLHITHIIL